MPPRDPSKIQLDFPLLTADLIRQLSLTGVVGVLDFNPVVTPVFIIGDRNLAVEAAPPVWTSAQIVNGFAAAPAVNAIIVDTGQLPAGTYDIFGQIGMNGTGGGNSHIELQHRNAANAANLAVLLDLPNSAGAAQVTESLRPIGYVIAENERLRIQLVVSSNSGSLVGIIGFRIRPVP